MWKKELFTASSEETERERPLDPADLRPAEPTSGEYSIYGKKYTSGDILQMRRRMGAVVEIHHYLDMTAGRKYPGTVCDPGRPSYEGITELLELVGLSGTGRKKAKNFPWGCVSVWGLPLPLRVILIFWCWMNR